jgi:DNA topoisomerase-3
MVQVCEGGKTKKDMLDQSIEQYKEMFMKARGEFAKVMTVSGHRFGWGGWLSVCDF